MAAALLLTGPPASAQAPSGRVWELVSTGHQGFPTGAGPLSPAPNPRVWVPAEGGRVVYPSADPFTGDSGQPGTFESRRTATGWTTTNLLPTAPEANLFSPLLTVGVSDDGTKLIFRTLAPLLAGDVNGVEDVYLFDETTKLLTLVSAGATEDAEFEGRSRDASHIFFQTTSNLMPPAAGSAMKLYEWVNGAVRLVGILPDGSVPAGGSVLGGREDFTAFTRLPINAVSPDGSVAYFTSPAPTQATPSDPMRVYARAGGTTTVEASASHCTRADCNAPADVLFQGASRDGSRVFLATTQQLTNEDTNEDNDLYAYDRASGTLTLLSPGVGAGFQQTEASAVLGSSDDGQRVYFRGGEPGRPIYLWDHGTLTQIGTPDFSLVGADENCEEDELIGTPDVTPSGDVLVFGTSSFEPAGPGPSGPGLYRYAVSSGTLVKLAPSGSLIRSADSTSDVECPLRKSISDDGSSVFFVTADALVPRDVNGVDDVYQWHDGAISLVSSGRGTLPAVLFGTSRDARDVFFTAGDALVPEDADTVQDVYDARIGGGFPHPSPPGECSGDGCRALASPPRLPSPASDSLPGAEHRPRQALFVLERLSRRATRRLAAAGELGLKVRIGAPGTVRARASAQLGGRRRIVAATTKRLDRGAARLVLRLSTAARARLRHARRLRIEVTVAYTRAPHAKHLALTLRLG